MARKTRSKMGSGSKTAAGTEPPNSPDTEIAEGKTLPPMPMPDKLAEGSDQAEQWPDLTATNETQRDDMWDTTPEMPLPNSEDPTADRPLSPSPSDADQTVAPDMPDTEPFTTLDDPAMVEDQSASEAANGPGGTAEPEAEDPFHQPMAADAGEPFSTDKTSAEPADTPDATGVVEDQWMTEPAPGPAGIAEPEALDSFDAGQAEDADQTFPSDMPDAERTDILTAPAITEDQAMAAAAPGADDTGVSPQEAADPAEPVTDQNTPDSVTPTSATPESAASETQAPAAPASPPPPPPAPKRSIFPLLLGGVLAGGIGFGAQTLLDQNAPAGPDVAGLEAEVAELRAALAAQPAPADLSSLEAELAALREQIANLPAADGEAASEDMNAAIDQLRAEFAQAEGVDLSPLEAQIEGLADIVSGQQATLDSTDTRMTELQTVLNDTDARMNALQADLADLRDLAERRVVEAEAAIDAARAQAGLDSLRAALETGAPYRDAVVRLTDAGVAVPDALAGPADSGVATLEALQDGFDDAARNALRVALQDAPTETATDRIGNFLRAQVGARSTVPREGDDPDAVLSRAAAAMEAGDLAGALAEIEALPDPAQAAMAEWLAAARARIAAQAALPDLTTAITTE